MIEKPERADVTSWHPRLARESDIAGIDTLIPLSVRALQSAHYSPAQMDAAIGPIFGVDRQLIRDGTYFVVEHGSQIIACGGWSKRRATSGSDAHRTEDNPEVDPQHDPARIRAFFVHPDWARRGLGTSIMTHSERALIAAGFRTVEIVATLTGELLYVNFGYRVVERYDLEMTGGLRLPVVRLTKHFAK